MAKNRAQVHGETNLALGKLVEMSSLYEPESPGSKAVDGKTSGDWYDKDKAGCASTKYTENPWMLVDLGVVSLIKKIKIYARTDCCRSRFRNYQIDVSSEKPSVENANTIYSSSDVAPEVNDVSLDDEQTGRYVRIRMAETSILTICELEVYGVPVPVDGGWSENDNWCTCSTPWGTGLKSRSRTCTNPIPAYDGANCIGEEVETAPCEDTEPCPDECSPNDPAGVACVFDTTMTVTPQGEYITEITLTFTAAFAPSCFIDFGNGEAKAIQVTDYNEGLTISYKHNASGFYDINTICMTDDRADEAAVIDTFVGDFIEGFVLYNSPGDLVPVIAPVTQDVNITLWFDNGTDVVLTVRLLHNNVTVQLPQATAQNEHHIQFAPGNFTENGIYSAMVSAENPLSGKIEFPITIAIQQEIIVLELLINKGTNYVEVETPFEIDVTLTSGEDVTITISVFDVSNTTIGIQAYHCEGLISDHKAISMVNLTGTYFISVAISNMVSVHTATFKVVVEYAVNSLDMTVLNNVSLHSDSVTFIIANSLSIKAPVGTVTCLIDFGDGNNFTLAESIMSDSNIVSMSTEHTYSAGFYKSVVICTNKISTTQTFNEDLRIENPVDHIHLENSTDYIPLSAWIIITAKLDDPSDLPLYMISCIFDLGDGEEVIDVLGNITDLSNIEQMYRYRLPGQYTITVNCSAQLTNKVMSISVEAYWDCWTTRPSEPGFFDLQYQSDTTPVVFYAHKVLELKSMVELSDTCNNYLDSLIYIWTFLGPLSLDSNEEHTATGNYKTYDVPPNTLNEGKYKVQLVSQVKALDGASQSDYMYIESKLPELNPVIEGGQERIVQYGFNILIDASESTDPADGLSDVAIITLEVTWTCHTSTTQPIDDDDVALFFSSGTTDVTTIASADCGIVFTPGQMYQDFQTASFPLDQWYIFKFTMTRGTRTRSIFQAVKPLDGDPIEGSLKCQSNCHGKSKEGLYKIGTEDLQLDAVITDDGVDLKTMTYLWYLKKLVDGAFVDISDELTAMSKARDQSGICVPGDLLEPGGTYRVSCDVNAVGYAKTPVSESYIVNWAPRDGSCNIDKYEGASGVTVFCVECTGWIDEEDRVEKGAGDTGSQLLYEFLQFNEGATITHIIYTISSVPRNCMSLAVPRNGTDKSIVLVKVKDTYGRPEGLWEVEVTVKPFLNIEEISRGNAEGATLVKEFTDLQTEKMEKSLASGDVEKVATDVTVATSNIIGIKVEGQPPVIELDLKDPLADVVPGQDPITSEDALKDFEAPKEVDNATQAVQKSLDTFTDYMATSMENTLVNANKQINPVSLSQTAIAFSTILSTDQQNIAPETKTKIASNINKMTDILVLEQVDTESADFLDSLADLQQLQGGLIKAVVPAELASLELALDMTSVGILNEAVFECSDQQTQQLRDQADMSVHERNYVFLKNQLLNKVTVEKRKLEAKKAAESFEKTSTAIQSTLHQSDGSQNVIKSGEGDEVVQVVVKNKAAKLAEEPIVTNKSTIKVHGLEDLPDESVVIAVTESKGNVYMYDDNHESSRVTSGITRLQLQFPAGVRKGRIVIQENLPETIYERRIPLVDPDDASELAYYITVVKSDHDLLCIATKPTEDTVDKYSIFINYETNPTNIDYIAKEEAHSGNDWTVCFHPEQRKTSKEFQIGRWNYGIRTELKESHRKRRSATNTTTSDNSTLPAVDIAVATMACMTWDKDKEAWISNACDGKWIPDKNILECSCVGSSNELTFGNSFYVPPNKIDFSSVFLKFSPLNQAAVMATLLIVFFIYIAVVIWARRQDKKDLLKWGITPLVDNFPEDNYFYVVKVYTGMRPGAGTKSKVSFVAAGDEMDTGIRELSDGIRTEFTTGSIMNFLLSTNASLGQLEYMRIWHDNSGGGSDASWYLSKIEIQDIQLNETFIFQSERWLAVEKEDGHLECVVPVSRKDDLNVFKNRFLQNAKDNLADNHVWVSVLYRPSTSSFTRVQRASCALVFVMLTMIANAMFFKSEDNYETPAVVRVGPFRFSLQQIYISIICALISTPPTIAVIYLFKMSKRKLPKPTDNIFMPRRARKYTVPFWDDWMNKKLNESMELEQNLVAKGYPQLQGFTLPYWCNYIAWFLSVAAFVLSAFFIMLYSMEWGKQKSEEWVTTFLLSFFESVLCLDPVKIAVMALIFAIIFRSVKDSDAMIERKTVMQQYSSSLRGKSNGIRLPAPPLDSKCLEDARLVRKRELMMKSAFKNVVINLFVCWLLFSISYSNRDNRSYYLHDDVVTQILKPAEFPKFMDIRSINDYYEWLNNTAIQRLFPENDINGDRLHWRQRQFITGEASFRLGPPRLRQLRVKKENCVVSGISTKGCFDKYYEIAEETGSYCIGWGTGDCNPNDEIYKHSSSAWTFTSAIDVWGFPVPGYYTTYGGGGYIAKWDVNKDVSQKILNELYESSWVDRQTRAVVLEFTLYCFNINLFMYNMFMVEFPETGGAFPYHVLLPLRVYQHNGATGVYTLACEVLFVIFLLALTVQIIIYMVQQKRNFFRKPWQVLDLIVVIVSYCTIAMYGMRLLITSSTIAKFKANKNEFVNFYHIAIWDQVLVLLIGILDFIVTIRLLNILGYNKRIGAVVRVFSTAASDLLWFGIFFVFIFTSYAVFGYLLFGSNLESYRNVYATMGTLFISMIGKSRFTEIDDTDPIMSKIYFMIFIFFVVYCILTMFLAVLSKSIEAVHSEIKDDKGEEMMEYLLNKFKDLIGYGENRHPKPVRRNNPPAPWSMGGRRVSMLDNRSILNSIRMSLNEALQEQERENTSQPATKANRKKMAW